MSVREAGRKGGEKGQTTKAQYGTPSYREIGRNGGHKVRDLINAGKQTDEK
jgi:general stress protein YciG